jgi:hypothetical protein
MSKDTNPTTEISPQELIALQRGLFSIIESNLPIINEVMQGKRIWSNAQVRLFTTVLGKMVPDLKHTRLDVSKDINEMSVAELQQLVESLQSPPPSIDITPNRTGDPAPSTAPLPSIPVAETDIIDVS